MDISFDHPYPIHNSPHQFHSTAGNTILDYLRGLVSDHRTDQIAAPDTHLLIHTIPLLSLHVIGAKRIILWIPKDWLEVDRLAAPPLVLTVSPCLCCQTFQTRC